MSIEEGQTPTRMQLNFDSNKTYTNINVNALALINGLKSWREIDQEGAAKLTRRGDFALVGFEDRNKDL